MTAVTGEHLHLFGMRELRRMLDLVQRFGPLFRWTIAQRCVGISRRVDLDHSCADSQRSTDLLFRRIDKKADLDRLAEEPRNHFFEKGIDVNG